MVNYKAEYDSNYCAPDTLGEALAYADMVTRGKEIGFFTLSPIDIKDRITSTLAEGFKFFVNKRRAGNTTRQIDYAVDQILQGKVVVCLDHHNYGSNRRANEDMARRIVQRLTQEHGFKKKSNHQFGVWFDATEEYYLILKDSHFIFYIQPVGK